MYFDFDDHRPETPSIGRPMSTREVVLITVNLHLVFLVAILMGPRLPFVKEMLERQRQEQARLQEQELERQKENARFVFVQPKLETPAPKPPPRAELSDLDRRARSAERAPDPRNPLPFSRGNSAERVDSTPEARRTPAPAAEPEPPGPSASAAAPPLPVPDSTEGFRRSEEQQPPARTQGTGILADAIRNVQRYATSEKLQNLQGSGNQEDPFINFDTKGVEFGPWIARFVAQVRRNWFIPMAAMSMHGRVVITFFVHKDGRITDVTVARPSTVDAFTLSARNAILASNPTVPLPPEYPDDKAFFTVTFFFNENPGTP